MRRGAGVLGVALAVGLGAPPGAGHEAEAPPSAPGDEGLRYELPAPGSYELPPIARVRERRLLDSRGRSVPLLGLAEGELAVVSFVYTSCAEAQGCPLALAVLQRLDRRVARDPVLRERVRLVSVSFDPDRDTPARLAAVRERLQPSCDWRFLTAADEAAIRPVLEDFGQDALALVDEGGAQSGVLRHVLKVFLVDAAGAIRNVYSTGFLSPELLELDLRTLLLERQRRAAPPAPR